MNDDADPPPVSTESDATRQVELVISLILRGGVAVSLLLVLVGLAISFRHHPAYLHSRQSLPPLVAPGRNTPHHLMDVFRLVRAGRGEAVIMLGLLLLIATPVLRVAVSIVAFLVERDTIFVILTSLVLAMLLMSFLLGRVEGG